MNESLATHNFSDYFNHYIGLVDDQEDVISALEHTNKKTKEFLDLIAEEQGNYSYAEDKWTVKELLVHLIDTERILAYRALCFARNEKDDLPGYNHDEYVRNSGANERSLYDICKEHNLVRLTTVSLFKSFTKDMLAKGGTANNIKVTVLSLGYIIAGHGIHHINVLDEKYLD